MEYLILLLTGMLGGLIASMLGLGGGIFYILVLPHIMVWFGIPAESATPFVVANSLIGIAFASGISIVSQYGKLKKYIKESLLIGIPAVVISLLTTKFIVYSPLFSKDVFGVFVILLMLFILFQMHFIKDRNVPKEDLDNRINTKTGIFTGSLAGFISAISGLGGGIIINPILQLRLHQSLQKARIISLTIIFISASFISLQNILSTPSFQPEHLSNFGFIIPTIAIPLIIGVVLGSPFGLYFSRRLSDKTLNGFFSAFVFMVLIEKIISLF